MIHAIHNIEHFLVNNNDYHVSRVNCLTQFKY